MYSDFIRCTLQQTFERNNPMATRVFECSNCGSFGKITVKGSDSSAEDIVYCPVCSADIYEEEEILDDE